MKEFYTKYSKPEYTGEKNTGEIITDKYDYVPATTQITRLLQAGQRLKVHRRQDYDFGANEKVPDDFVDPTRSPDFDLVDVSEFESALQQKLSESEKKKKEEEEAQKELDEKTPPVEKTEE